MVNLKIRTAVNELKKKQQTLQYCLFREFCNTDMSIDAYLNKAEKIDRDYYMRMAELLLEEVLYCDQETA